MTSSSPDPPEILLNVVVVAIPVLMADRTSAGTMVDGVGGEEEKEEGAMVGVADPDDVDPAPDVVDEDEAIVDPTPELVVLWESVVDSLSPAHVVDLPACCSSFDGSVLGLQ